ncbi:hypothetical protein ABZV77_11155 [Streptomyces sp. NPDC004732]|uniref:hypothetical protein n=1 Tax=Streptomyces sp. NPDC004732 TaxID=3154290 RepID=UPI0033A1518F
MRTPARLAVALGVILLLTTACGNDSKPGPHKGAVVVAAGNEGTAPQDVSAPGIGILHQQDRTPDQIMAQDRPAVPDGTPGNGTRVRRPV